MTKDEVPSVNPKIDAMGLIGISARQARADLGTSLVPLAFSTETVTRRQELHCKTGRSYPPG